jgi:WD40 repeat protein
MFFADVEFSRQTDSSECYNWLRHKISRRHRFILASGNDKGQVHIWNTMRNEHQYKTYSHQSYRHPITGITQLSNDKFLTITENQYTTQIDTTSKTISIFQEKDVVEIITIGEHFVVVSSQSIELHNKTKKLLEKNLGYSQTAACALQHDTFAVSERTYNSNKINIFSLKLDKIRSLDAHKDKVHCLLLLRNGKLASGSEDRTIRIWDTDLGTCLQTIRALDYVRCMCQSGSFIAAGGLRHEIILYDTLSKARVILMGAHDEPVNALVELGESIIASGSEDKKIKIWDTSTREVDKVIEEEGSITALIKVETL